MELYEIVKFIRKPIKGEEYFEPVVVTATMDKQIAEQMLEIYQQNADENESYRIRTLRELKPQPFDYFSTAYEHCLACKSYNTCKDVALNQPNNSIRCINFGGLKKYVQST